MFIFSQDIYLLPTCVTIYWMLKDLFINAVQGAVNESDDELLSKKEILSLFFVDTMYFENHH